jgi:hypothetical protein
VNGPTWGGGKTGTALSFDGTNDYIDLGTPAALRHPHITVSARIVPSTLTGGRTIIGYDKASGQSYNLGIGQFVAGELEFAAFSGSWFVANAAGVLAIGELTHVAGVYDGTNLNLYVNGRLVDTTASAQLDYTAPQKLNIGSYWNNGIGGGGNFFGGWIDDVRIYARALTALEIRQLYLTDFSEFRSLFRPLPVFPVTGSPPPSSGFNRSVTVVT